jgi:hypothetical protein
MFHFDESLLEVLKRFSFSKTMRASNPAPLWVVAALKDDSLGPLAD